MPAKRGRPLSGESDDPKVDRRRELERVRQRRRRERQVAQSPLPANVTSAQQEQGDRIINLPSIEEEDAATTLLSLGMRKSPDLEIPVDPSDALLQESAQIVDEHVSLYSEERRKETGERQGPRPSVAGFFRRFAGPIRPRSEPISNDAGSPPVPNNVSKPCNEDEFCAPSHQSSPLWYGDNDITSEADRATEVRATTDEHDRNIGDTANHVTTPCDENIHSHIAELSVGSEDLLGEEQLGPPSEDEESHVSFVSEREVDEEGEAALEQTSEKLFAQLQGGHHGCSEERHEEELRKHLQREGENHHSLGDIFHGRRLPSAFSHEGLMTPADLDEYRVPTAEQWKAMFCGVPVRGGQTLPMNVCLHKEQTQTVESQVAFDIDSFLGFWSSLAAAKRGFSYQPAAQATQNLQTDVHLEMDAFHSGGGDDDTLRACRKMLRDVPHFLLGRVHGANNITVHVLFPHLPMSVQRDRFVSMTEEQSARWTDQVFHPALWRVLPAHYTQHLPPTYRVALADSKANQVEARKIQTSSYQAQQAIAYHLQTEYLQELWAVVLDIISNTPGLADFREAQLFFTAKGTKLMFQSCVARPTLLDVMEHFESYLGDIVDLRYVEQERFYVDLGKEICANASLLPGQHCHVGEEAQVYSWKRCCLEEYMQWMYDGQPPSHRAQGQRYYHQNMLYDASSLTSVTPKQSKLRKGGLIYSQFYGSVKEMTDASKCKPFENDALEEMALDPQLRRAARNVAGGHRREAQIVEMAYKASKRRARAALADSLQRSFGIREEHRMTWKLFQRLKALLEVEEREALEIVMTDCPRYAWPVRTKVYLDFLRRSADKFATGFEVVLARCHQDVVTWEETKLMFAFLRCLRFVMGGHRIERESAMWWSRRVVGEDAQQRSVYGLGFSNTLPRYKYCWMEPRIDWECMRFQPSVTNGMLFGNSVLRGQVMRRGAQVTAFFDMALALERGMEWLRKNRDNETIRDQLVSWMVHICLQQFRIDVLRAVKAEIREESREEALKGQHPFSYEYFEEIMVGGCYLMSGNRCDFKAPSHLAHFLLDEGDGRSRQHWEDKPFRKLYRRARAGLGVEDAEFRETFTRRYWRWLFEFHWVLPYPCKNALLQTSKAGGRRMWYSIKCDGEQKRWTWGRKNWEAGQPRNLPGFVKRSEEEWTRWIVERGGVEETGEDSA